MTHFFFKPSDIRTIVCSVTNKTKSGAAFAVSEDNENVFIHPNIVEQNRIEIGDFLTAYCIDNHRPEVEAHFSARWRAIRVVVKERFAAEIAETKTELTTEQIMEKVMKLLQRNRAWTSAQIAAQIGSDSQRVSTILNKAHESGRIAAAKLSTSGSQDRCSFVFFARDVALLSELIDEVELDD